MRLAPAFLAMTFIPSAPALQITFNPYSTSPLSRTAADVLRGAIHALENVHTVEYEVRVLPAMGTPDDDLFYKGTTTVTATTGSPIRYRARFQSTDPPAVSLAVSDGQKVRISEDGELYEHQTRVMEDRASSAALPTLQLFDVERYRAALAANNALYLGQDDVEGELCYVIAAASPFKDEVGGDTFFYWISAVTGLPRSRQTYRVMHGQTRTTLRWIVSNIRLNPDLPADLFSYHPVSKDSVAAPVASHVSISQPAATETSLAGKIVPGLEVRDLDYKPVSLASAVKGQPTIITLWATWCGPCMAELPALQKLLDRHPGKLRVIALTMDDSRLAALHFVAQHPEYKFTFLTDPDAEDPGSPVSRFFVGEGVPRSALVDPAGKVTDYVLGYSTLEDNLTRKVEAWLRQLEGAK